MTYRGLAKSGLRQAGIGQTNNKKSGRKSKKPALNSILYCVKIYYIQYMRIILYRYCSSNGGEKIIFIFLFLKEKQDLEVEFLKGKVRDLSSQAEGLQWQLQEVEERTSMEAQQLQVPYLNFSPWQLQEVEERTNMEAQQLQVPYLNLSPWQLQEVEKRTSMEAQQLQVPYLNLSGFCL
jgi:hypothetical protein